METRADSRFDAELEFDNDGPRDVWGIYKTENRPWIYASDRNGGLYVLKEFGAGTMRNAGKNGKK